MAKQLKLLPDLEVECGGRELNVETLVKLEKVARESANLPFVFGENRFQFQKRMQGGKSSRLGYILQYFNGEISNVVNFVATFGEDFVGYAGIWSGVVGCEGEKYTALEVAFLHPTHHRAYLDKFKKECVKSYLNLKP